MHLRWLVQPPSALTMAMAVLRFNCSVSYGGLQFATSQEGIFFSENKDKSIHAALSSLVEDDGSNVSQLSHFIFMQCETFVVRKTTVLQTIIYRFYRKEMPNRNFLLYVA